MFSEYPKIQNTLFLFTSILLTSSQLLSTTSQLLLNKLFNHSIHTFYGVLGFWGFGVLGYSLNMIRHNF